MDRKVHPGMDREEMRRLVATARVARLATVGERGAPHLVPICFALDGDRLYSAVDRKPKRSRSLERLANIARNPAISVLVDHYEEDWTRLWWVRLDGTASVVDEGATFERALELLTAKYEQYALERPPGPVIVVDVETWRGWRSR